MVNKQTSAPWYSDSLMNVFDFDENSNAYTELTTTSNELFKWLQSMNWVNITPLESLCLVSSEISEAHEEFLNSRWPSDSPVSVGFGTDGYKIKLIEEMSDVVLRLYGFCEMFLSTSKYDALLSTGGIISHHTVVDNRFIELNSKYIRDPSPWLLAINTKLMSCPNFFRGKDYEIPEESVLDFQARMNQVFYMCFILMSTLLNQDSEHKNNLCIDTVIDQLKMRLRRNLKMKKTRDR